MDPARIGASSTRGSQAGPTLWAVGGGKGGVGKSLVSSSLAISFARRGHRCALIDLDLGAANLHSLLGMAPPRKSLKSFLERDVGELSELLSPTPFPNLVLAGGARASLDTANPKYSQKEKLLRHIRGLDFDHVFLDLSAGCAFNVLDFFLAAERRIAVLVPERTAIENTQHFLKTAFFRSLRGVARHEPLRGAIRAALGQRDRLESARDLLAAVARVDPGAGRVLAARAAEFSPMLIVNQVGSTAGQRSGAEIALACRHYLASSVRERANLPRDERVREAVAGGTHVLDLFPGSRFAVAVESLVEDLLADAPPAPLGIALAAKELAAGSARTRPPDWSAPGAYLRGRREQLGLTIADLGRRTRIRGLAKIEDERFEELPAESTVGSFVRQYASALGIREADRLAECYLERYRTAKRRPRTASWLARNAARLGR